MGREHHATASDTTVWLVQAMQMNGRWEPIAAPSDRPFTQKQAKRARARIVQRVPNAAHRIRIWPYRAMAAAPESLTAPPEELMDNIVYVAHPRTRVVLRTYLDTGREIPITHHIRHSPDGFNWGYSGSGPAELARCLLWDVMGYEPEPALYQAFKAEVISGLVQDQPWQMPISAIVTWLSSRNPRVHVMTPGALLFRQMLAEAGHELTPKEILDILGKAELLAESGVCPTCGHEKSKVS